MLHARWIRNQEGRLVAVWTQNDIKGAIAAESVATRATATVIPFNRSRLVSGSSRYFSRAS